VSKPSTDIYIPPWSRSQPWISFLFLFRTLAVVVVIRPTADHPVKRSLVNWDTSSYFLGCVYLLIGLCAQKKRTYIYAGSGVNVNPVFREVWSGGGGVRGSAPIAAQGTWVCWAPAEPIRAQPHPPWRTTHPVADPVTHHPRCPDFLFQILQRAPDVDSAELCQCAQKYIS
jgi:hypothetical protein